MSESSVRNAIRQNIVNLMLATLQKPSPNLAQYLLGFELQKSIAKTVFQDPGKKFIRTLPPPPNNLFEEMLHKSINDGSHVVTTGSIPETFTPSLPPMNFVVLTINFSKWSFYQDSYWTWKTWKIGHFYEKSGKTWNCQGICNKFYPS